MRIEVTQTAVPLRLGVGQVVTREQAQGFRLIVKILMVALTIHRRVNTFNTWLVLVLPVGLR